MKILSLFCFQQRSGLSTKFFTNEGDNTLLNKFAGVFKHNPDIEFFGTSIEFDPSSASDLPKGFMRLSYQVDAVNQEISTFHAFAWDEENYFANNKCFLIPDASKFLLGILNAPTTWWFLGNLVTKLNGGAYAMQAPYVTQIPIPAANSELITYNSELATGELASDAIEQRVETILKQKKENQDADVSVLENEINQIVYKLYGLTDAEIAIMEDAKWIQQFEINQQLDLLCG